MEASAYNILKYLVSKIKDEDVLLVSYLQSLAMERIAWEGRKP